MLQELWNGVDSYPARWTASDNNTATALRHEWRFVYEIQQIDVGFLSGLLQAGRISARVVLRFGVQKKKES
jgi:hypothetical protein